MKTPVIIAAYNEAAYIEQSLKHLDAHSVEPIVITNGCTDSTAELARRYTDNVYELPEMGKIPAIQYGLKTLGKAALEPVLLLDADAWPLFPSHWAHAMRSAVKGVEPAVASGMTGFWDGTAINCTVRSARRIQRALSSRVKNDFMATYGANMVIQLASPTMFDEIMAMEHTWPAGDRYLAHKIKENGTFKQSVNPITWVNMSARYVPTLSERLHEDTEGARQKVAQEHMLRRAPTATHYYRDGTIYSYADEQQTALN